MISIVIRTYNEEKYLRKSLEAILDQSYKDYEIIIVDSGSEDQTLLIAKDFNCKIVHIQKSEFTFGKSLNYGCSAAAGDILVFLSAHCIPTKKDWLAKLIEVFKNVDVAMVYGRQKGYSSSKFSEHSVFDKYFPSDSSKQQGGFFCNNANSAIRKDLWEKYPFNENLTGLEDMDWAKHFFYKGFKIVYQPNSCVFHIHEESWRKVKIRYEREAYALREIMPEIHFNFKDFIRSFVQGVFRDTVKNVKQKYLPTELIQIILFRFCQFYGAYKGNQTHRKISTKKKTNYFYP